MKEHFRHGMDITLQFPHNDKSNNKSWRKLANRDKSFTNLDFVATSHRILGLLGFCGYFFVAGSHRICGVDHPPFCVYLLFHI
jgi:hypothetical protein